VTEAQTTEDAVAASTKAAAFAKPGDFNRVQIRCEGKTVIVRVNRILTVCKSHASMADEGFIALELDGRQQAGEVAFKDFKFTDLTRAGKAIGIAHPPANSNAMLKVESDYSQSIEKARRHLVSSFDAEITQRTSQSSHPARKHTGSVALLEQERKAFLKKGQIPWSRQMRPATCQYLTELETMQQRMEKMLAGEIAAAKRRGDDKATAELETAEKRILAPHVVATARFAGASLSFRSDGIVEKSNDETAGCWRLSPDKHDDVIIETPDNSEPDNATQQAFHISEDGASLTETSGNGKRAWLFVDT
jgi:hypothetical protein